MFLPLLSALAAATPSPAAHPLLTWPDLVGRSRPKPDATVSYGPDQMQKVDVWLPAGPGPHPVVLMVHGGCWTTSIADRTLMNWIAADLRHDGIAVWNIDYRGVDRRGGGYPGTFADAAAASDLLLRDGRRFGLDLSRYGMSHAEMIELFEHQHGLILNYGDDYGPGGEGHIRLNLGTQRALLEQGLVRMRAALSGRTSA